MMRRFVFNRADKFDSIVFLIVKITLAGTAALLAASFIAGFSPLWVILFVALGMLLSWIMILAKGAFTGKRYGQGAKHRREKLFPMFFHKNDSLADDAMKLWRGDK